MKMIVFIMIVTNFFLMNSLAQANEQENLSKQNLSKRAYQELPEVTLNKSAEAWEGATLVKEKQNGPTDYQKLRIHMLGKQPYMEGKKD